MIWKKISYPSNRSWISSWLYNSKKYQLFEELNTDPDNVNARLFVLLVRHRQVEMISDGNKKLESKVI